MKRGRKEKGGDPETVKLMKLEENAEQGTRIMGGEGKPCGIQKSRQEVKVQLNCVETTRGDEVKV